MGIQEGMALIPVHADQDIRNSSEAQMQVFWSHIKLAHILWVKLPGNIPSLSVSRLIISETSQPTCGPSPSVYWPDVIKITVLCGIGYCKSF